MSFLHGLRHRLHVLFNRSAYDDELARERDFHLSLEEMHQRADGQAPPAARSAARRRFGNHTTHAAAQRQLAPLHALSQITQDVQFTLRQLRRAPMLVVGVIGTFAIGIGVTTAVFDLLDRTMLRPPALLTHANEMHRVVFTGGDYSQPYPGTDYRTFVDLERGTTSFAQMATYWTSSGMAIGSGSNTEEQPVAAFSASFWSMFAARPVLGRFFRAEEDQPPIGERVAVLSHDFWQSRFGGRTDVIGTMLQVGTTSYQVIGVAPPAFRALSRGAAPAVFVPLSTVGSTVMGPDNPTRWARSYGGGWLTIVARRKTGVTTEQATSDLTQAYLRSRAQAMVEMSRTPSANEVPARAIAAHMLPERGPQRSRNGNIVVWLAGVGVVILLIACANVAHLLVVHADRRVHEFAVRSALGVSRWRLVQQLLTESLVLSLAGGVVGAVMAAWSGNVLRKLVLGLSPDHVGLVDWRVMMAAGAIALAAGLLAGCYPAWTALTRPVATGLKAGARAGSRESLLTRSLLLGLQAALSVMLLVGALLFVHSMRRVQALPLGYDVAQLLYLRPQERAVSLSPDEREALLTRLADAARAMPGVTHVSRMTSVPFWNARSPQVFRSSGDSLPRDWRVVQQAASPEYFAAMGTALLRGRGIVDSDQATSEPVMVVSDSLAARLWPGRDPIGECLRAGAADAPCARVVGVAVAIRRDGLLEDAGNQYYIPATQSRRGDGGIVVRLAGDAAADAERVRRTLQPLLPADSYVTPLPLTNVVDPLLRSWRVGAWLFTALGALALVLACGGLSAIIAYDVTRRAHELAVRLALGARDQAIVRLVFVDTMRISVLGVGIGVVLTVLLAPHLQSQLFETPARDARAIGIAAITLLAAAALAAWLPAMRAARIPPARALREG
ncbi:MAG TPA: ADOP family duplicated permease [Gemmatimonas sp.]|uniref:ADOP family duplicated permease n=1 Tax=Gemmatimonas sp. TaxID=1962908 RepID=UPI002EDA530C